MIIRKAEERDIPRIIELLGQVLQIHADIRPDIFIPDTTKYTVDELTELLKNEEKADICCNKRSRYLCGICILSTAGAAFFKQYGAV